MIIKEYTINHLGPFNDKFTLNLDVPNEQQKPIILIGGSNGRGKTHLFEGIKLCLYGVFFRGKKLSEREYQNYILDTLHKPKGLTSSEGGYVSLLFTHTHLGNTSTYFVKRSWSLNPLKENLEILENGEPIKGIPKANLQNFLFELIPFGLSDLFFFDGEKIQNLAKDKTNKVLFNSINSLFGIDTLTNLKSDLGIFLRKENKTKKHTNKNLQNTLHTQIDSLQKQIDQLETQRQTFVTNIDDLKSDIQETEQEFSEVGGIYFQNYSNIQRENENLDKDLESKEMEIREHLMELFPFVLIPDLLTSLQDRISIEKEFLNQRNSFKHSQTIREKIINSLKTSDILSTNTIKSKNKTSIIKNIDLLFEEYNKEPDTIDVIFNLPESNIQQINTWISESRRLPKEIEGKFTNIEELIQKINENKEFLAKSPPEEKVTPILESLKGQHKELGHLESELNTIDTEITSITNEKDQKINELVKEEQLNLEVESTDRKIKYALQSISILDSFIEKLQKQKLEEISQDFCGIYNEITDYKLDIKSIKINNETNTIDLHYENGTKISKHQLSAGERQIYATAMLMSLAKNTDKPLPFIIDTPLARLDEENRQGIVDKVFANTKHQLIILSTSSEINKKFYRDLKSYTTRSYLINFDKTKKESSIHPG